MSGVQLAAVATTEAMTQAALPQATAHPAAANAARSVSMPQALAGADRAADKAAPTGAQAEEALAYLQDHLASVAPNLQFSIDQDTGRVVIKVVDAATDEVIRQIPPDEILRLSKALDKLQGLLLDKQA